MGCGGGLFTAAFALSGYQVAGVDLSPEEIARAERFANRVGVAPSLFTGDLQARDWIDRADAALGGQPDSLFYGYCLHHLPDVTSHLKMIGEWLPAGAIVIVNEENPRSPAWFLKNAIRSVIQRDTKEEAQRSYSKWSELFLTAGFAPEGELQGADMMPAPMGLRWSQVFSFRRT